MDKKIKVLLLIDCQVDFIDGSLANEAAQKCIPNIVKKIKNFDGDLIILTQDTHYEDYLNTKEGQKLPVVHCVYKTHGWEINEDVLRAVNESNKRVTYILKPTFGAALPMPDLKCYNDLINEINSLYFPDKVEEVDIELVGFDTDICVISNALILKSWFYDDVEITVDGKCCAGVTPEKHEAALEVMRSCQINVI
jgi:nicotinamidase-related amidase